MLCWRYLIFCNFFGKGLTCHTMKLNRRNRICVHFILWLILIVWNFITYFFAFKFSYEWNVDYKVTRNGVLIQSFIKLLYIVLCVGTYVALLNEMCAWGWVCTRKTMHALLKSNFWYTWFLVYSEQAWVKGDTSKRTQHTALENRSLWVSIACACLFEFKLIGMSYVYT